MFSTIAKFGASVVFIAATANSTLGSFNEPVLAADVSVALEGQSLLVATLTNGETQMQWMSRSACEAVASAVARGQLAAGVRQDGVRIYISQANCSTRRVQVTSERLATNSPHDQRQ